MSDAAPVLKGDRSPELIAVPIVLTLFASFFVGARLYSRIILTKAVGWDDGFIAFSLAASWATTGLTCGQAANGYGKHIMTIPPDQIVLALKYSNFGVLTNGISMATMKISIGLSMLRIQLGKVFTGMIWGTIALSIIVNLNVLIGCFRSCTPMEKIWNSTLPGSCWPTEVNVALAYLQASGNITTDLLLTFGLLIFLSKLKVSTYNRWALRGIFLIGLVATICAIVKLTKLPALMKTQDPTWDSVDLTLWVAAEMAAGLFAASLPPLKTTFEGVLNKYFGVALGTSSSRYGYGSQPNKLYAGQNSRSHQSRGSRHHPKSSEVFEADIFDDHHHGHAEAGKLGNSAFVLETVRNKSSATTTMRSAGGGASEDDEVSVESDRRHITKHAGEPGTTAGGGGGWSGMGGGITKTVDYSVSEEVARQRSRGDI